MDESLTQRDYVKEEDINCKLQNYMRIMIYIELALAKLRASSRGKTYRASVHWYD